MQHQQSAEYIFLGDLVRRLASDSFRKLTLAIDAAPSQTPELRFEKFKLCAAKIKKQLCQVYALLVWLREDHVQKYINGAKLLTNEVQIRNTMQLNLAQDQLFYLHQGLHKRRILSLDVAMACDIMSRGTYAHLPEATFVMPTSGSNSSTDWDLDVMNRELSKKRKRDATNENIDICIGYKVKFRDTVPSNCTIEIKDGQLVITRNKFFELILTLSYDSEEAPWILTKCTIQVEHAAEEGRVDSIGRSKLESEILPLLQKAIEGNQKQFKPIERVIKISQYVASSALLKLLFLQALEVSRFFFNGFAKAEYVDNEQYSIVAFHFWTSAKNRCVN